MVIGVFPIGKIALLGIKQITSPLSRILKDVAKSNPLFRKCLCAPAGQLINCFEARCKMRMLRLPQPKRIPSLSEEMAVNLGANLMSEVFVMGLGLYFIYFEVSRQSQNDQINHDKHTQNRKELKAEISTINNLLDWQETEIKQLTQQLNQYNRRTNECV